MFAIEPLRYIATVHAVWRFMLQFRSSFQLFFYFRDAFLRPSHSFPPRVFPVLHLDVSLDFIECYKFESWFRFGAIYFGSAICEVRHSIWSEKGRAFSEIKNNILFLAAHDCYLGSSLFQSNKSKLVVFAMHCLWNEWRLKKKTNKLITSDFMLQFWVP